MYFEDLKIGDKISIPPIKTEKEDMISFSKRFNDIPIHTDEEYAKTTKFGDIIASGMMTFLVVWAEYVKKDFAGEQLVAGISSKIDWHMPVFAGDTLSAEAVITDLRPRSSRNGIMEVTITIFNQNGEKVLTNVTESAVKRNDIRSKNG